MNWNQFYKYCRRRRLSFVFLFLLLFNACGDDDFTIVKTNPFIGKWDITFTGSIQGSGIITVKDDSTFLSEITLSNGSGSVTISGTVSDQGIVVNGLISQGNSQIGSMQGKFSGMSGTGTWEANHNTGNWQAQKAAS